MHAPASPLTRDPAWPGRLGVLLATLVIAGPLLQATEFKPWVMLEPRRKRPVVLRLRGFVPPAVAPDFLALVARETWRTVAMATAGISLALVLAVPLALAASSSLSISSLAAPMAPIPRTLRRLVRTLLIALRSVPELVWALLLVRVVGLGPTAGVLAIALSYAGMLGKVYAEILESGSTTAARTLLGNGSSRLQAFCYALLPAHAAELSSYTVYRWECAIRSSVILGFVGAGGLGQQLDQSMKMLAGGEVLTMLIVFMALVALADAASTLLRRAL